MPLQPGYIRHTCRAVLLRRRVTVKLLPREPGIGGPREAEAVSYSFAERPRTAAAFSCHLSVFRRTDGSGKGVEALWDMVSLCGELRGPKRRGRERDLARGAPTTKSSIQSTTSNGSSLRQKSSLRHECVRVTGAPSLMEAAISQP